MKIVPRGMAIALAALILTGWTLPTPVEGVLYRFQGGSDGSPPSWPDRRQGGRALRHNGCGGRRQGGTVFQLTPARDKTTGKTTWTEKVLYRFQGGSDGSPPSWPDRRQGGRALRHNGLRRERRQGGVARFSS